MTFKSLSWEINYISLGNMTDARSSVGVSVYYSGNRMCRETFHHAKDTDWAGQQLAEMALYNAIRSSLLPRRWARGP